MKRISKGKAERLKKERERNDPVVQMLAHPVFQKLNSMQQIQVTMCVHNLAEESERQAEIKGYEKGMIDTVASFLQVLREVYWPKSPNKKFEQCVSEVTVLMDNYLNGYVTWENMAEYIERETGMSFKTDWMGQDKRPTPKDLFKTLDWKSNGKAIKS